MAFVGFEFHAFQRNLIDVVEQALKVCAVRVQEETVDIRSIDATIFLMKIIPGKIVAGKVVVDGEPFDEGALVSVFAHETHETFELTTEQEEDLLLSIEQAERGEFIAGAERLKSLRHDS